MFIFIGIILLTLIYIILLHLNELSDVYYTNYTNNNNPLFFGGILTTEIINDSRTPLYNNKIVIVYLTKSAVDLFYTVPPDKKGWKNLLSDLNKFNKSISGRVYEKKNEVITETLINLKNSILDFDLIKSLSTILLNINSSTEFF